jgi:hypothetical protein
LFVVPSIYLLIAKNHGHKSEADKPKGKDISGEDKERESDLALA